MSDRPTRVLLLHGIWMVGLTMRRFARGLAAVSYTHLTLPTILRV